MENLSVDARIPTVSPTPVISASNNGAASAEPVLDCVAPPKPLVADVETIALNSMPPKPSATTETIALSSMPKRLTDAPVRSNSFVVLASAVAVAAAFGSLAGALAATGWANSSAPIHTAVTGKPQDLHVVQATIEQVRSELGTLRTNIETGARNANTQFGKLAERFDRVERAQAERSAKLAKATESLERLERRTEATPAKEITGSIPLPTPAPAAASAPATVAHAPAPAPQPSNIPGWSVREVYRGTALIQSQRTGMIEVEAGDMVPYLGRIESIRRQDGRWVVVTSKGIIGSPR
jgi:hypothetical protein